nr:type IV pilus twitching motility protein PilT [Sporomusa acidovorans]
MIETLLHTAVTQKASDIHLSVGVPPIFRINGSLITTDNSPLTQEDTLAIFQAITSVDQQARFQENGELDFAFAINGLSRFRVNAYRQRGFVAIAVRVLNESIVSLDELGLPTVVKSLARMPRGLVLITGPTGSGKSTTLAAMVDLINYERSFHILTLEDPIEYLHQHRKCVISQREVPTDSTTFASGLKAALREDPDVIMVGEMRDAETIGIAVTAAETGHLVLASLHTCDAARTVDRIIDVFPPYQQQQIRIQLALTLQGIISQQLIPRCDGNGRTVAVEILMATPAVRNLIREGKTHQISSVIQTGTKFGMQSMDFSLKMLYQRGVISYQDALAYSLNQENFIFLADR